LAGLSARAEEFVDSMQNPVVPMMVIYRIALKNDLAG